jgi:hypothetical protein
VLKLKFTVEVESSFHAKKNCSCNFVVFGKVMYLLHEILLFLTKFCYLMQIKKKKNGLAEGGGRL